jgi:hypothetical protein
MSCSNRFCDECGGQVETETFEVRDAEVPAQVSIVTQGRCVICGRVISFGE